MQKYSFDVSVDHKSIRIYKKTVQFSKGMDYEKLFSSKMDEMLVEEMNRQSTPAMSIGIIEDGKYHMSRTYGSRDFEKNIPVTPETLFCIASVTKSFICAGILRLQEDDKLSINDPIAEYLPLTIGFDEDPITIHHLMTHTSGIPNLADGMWSRNREEKLDRSQRQPRYPFSSWDDAFRFINSAHDFIARPGKRFHYNNLGYGLLSKIISEVTGVGFKNYLRSQIFSPLGMNRTGFFSEIIGDENIAKAYMSKPESKTGEWLHVPYAEIRLTRSLDEAAGGLFSSVEELGKYMLMHLNKGKLGDKEVLSEASVSSMQQRHFVGDYPNDAFAQNYGQNLSGYGYGFAIDEDFHKTTLIQHSGSFIGSSAWFAFLPTYNRGVIILSNHHPSPRIFAQAILVESLGKDSQKEWPLFRLRRLHDKLTGEYHTYKGLDKIRIKSRDGQLYMSTLDGKNLQALIPVADHPFTMDYYKTTDMGGRLGAQFIEDNDSIFLHIERNKWKKMSDL